MRTLVLILSFYLLVVTASDLNARTATPPERTADNLIVAAYNIQWLGQKAHDLRALAKVIQNFDIVGIVEIKDENTLPELIVQLEAITGKDWGYVFGQRTHRPNGRYHEAYGAVWRRDRAQLGDGIVGGLWDLNEDFRNDPYYVSFVADDLDFTMLLLHTRWTDDSDGSREGEVKALAEHVVNLRGYLKENDILVAGDFNYSPASNKMTVLSTTAFLQLLSKFDNEETTFKADGSGFASSYDHFYGTEEIMEKVLRKSEAFDVSKFVYGSNSKSNMKKSRSQLSDHIPIFLILKR